MSRCLEIFLAVSLLGLPGCGDADADTDRTDSDDAFPLGGEPPESAPNADANPGSQPQPQPEPQPEPTVLKGVASQNSAFRVDVEWISGPDFEAEDNQLRLVFYTAGGDPAGSVEVSDFYPWMTSMGHGAPTIDLEWKKADAAKPDVWLVQGLMFTMGGTWDLTIEATVNGQADKALFPVEVPK